jgi:hypothetical protein
MIGLKRLKLFDRVAFLQSFEFHGFKYFLDKIFTVTWLHEWYQIYDIFSSFFFFFFFSYLHSWIHKRDWKSSMKLLLKASPRSYKGGINIAMKIHLNLKRNLLLKKNKFLNGGRHFTSRGLAQYWP